MTRVKLALLALLALACTPSEPHFRGVGHGTRERPERAALPQATPTPAPTPPPAPTPTPAPSEALGAPSREGWNESQIHWETYEAGLERARRESRPVLLVLSASWCGHCRTYSHVFEDARIVERSRRFVMVRVDSDARRDVAARYALDGGYVPRTYFLAPDGAPMADVTAHRPRFQYFFDENDPASLLGAMDQALTRG